MEVSEDSGTFMGQRKWDVTLVHSFFSMLVV